jgi:hypothetical protein
MGREQRCTCLLTAEGDIHDRLLANIQSKGGIQTQDAAVAEFDRAKQGILNGKLRRIPRAELAAVFMGAQLLKAVRRDAFYLRES